MQAPDVAPDDRAILPHHWFCPECEYDLTGLTENRCPECGTTFDPVELAEIYSGDVRPVPIWCERFEIGTLRAFGRTIRATLLHPRRFSRQLPWCFCTGEVMGFWLAARVCATLITIVAYVTSVLIVLTGKTEEIVYALGMGLIVLPFAGVCALVGTLLTEAVVAVFLRLTVRPRFPLHGLPDGDEFVYWWGAVAMFGGLIPLAAAVFGTSIVVWACTERAFFMGLAFLGVVWVASAWLAWIALAVQARGLSGAGRSTAIMILLLAAALLAIGSTGFVFLS